MHTARVSSKGQIAIPKAVREHLDLRQGTDLRVEIKGDTVVLQKISEKSWRDLEGAFKDVPLLEELAAERGRERQRDAGKST